MEKEVLNKDTSKVSEQQPQNTEQSLTWSKIAYYGAYGVFWGTYYTAYYAVRFAAKALYLTGYGLYKACEFGYNYYQNTTKQNQEETDTSKQPTSLDTKAAKGEQVNKPTLQQKIMAKKAQLKHVEENMSRQSTLTPSNALVLTVDKQVEEELPNDKKGKQVIFNPIIGTLVNSGRLDRQRLLARGGDDSDDESDNEDLDDYVSEQREQEQREQREQNRVFGKSDDRDNTQASLLNSVMNKSFTQLREKQKRNESKNDQRVFE